MSKSKTTKAKNEKHAGKPQPVDGELTDETLDAVAGGGGTSAMSDSLSISLQNALQKQEKAMETLSHVMKSQSDTASSIIKNIK